MLVNPEDIEITEACLVALLRNLKIISSDVTFDLIMNLLDLENDMYGQIYRENRSEHGE